AYGPPLNHWRAGVRGESGGEAFVAMMQAADSWNGDHLSDRVRRFQLTMQREQLTLSGMRLAVICILVSALIPSVSLAQEVPVFAITPIESSIKFDVEASVAIRGTFDKWN